MLNRKKVLIVTGTRADFGLLQPIIDAILVRTYLAPMILATGMHTLKKYGFTINQIRSLGYKISGVVPISENGTMLSWLSEEIEGISNFCQKNTVDCVLVLGDRDEMLAGAVVGAHLGIPVAHVHGGDLSGQEVVDSKNRDAITQYATYHFAATKKSSQRISDIIQGDENIFTVGAPGVDFIKSAKIRSRNNVAKKFNLSVYKRWLMVIMHPAPLSQLSPEQQIKPLIEVLSRMDSEFIWIYPNSDIGSDIFIQEIIKFSKGKKISLFKNLPREDFVNLLATVDLLVGNSSSGIIESTYFHLPVVNIGDRQSERERSTNVIDCNYTKQQIASVIKKALSKRFKKNCQKARLIYGNGRAGKKISVLLERNL